MIESRADQIARLEMMAAGDDKWDLSTKDCAAIKMAVDELTRLYTLRPAADYHEDFGCVLWFHLPICEPPYVGTTGEENADGEPTTCAQLIDSGWLTHWSPLPDTRNLTVQGGEVGE